MTDWAENADIIRIWALADAPGEFRKAFIDQNADSEKWVAHIPPGLMDEPIVALLRSQESPTQPVQMVCLPDGGRLLSGTSNVQRSPGALPGTTLAPRPPTTPLHDAKPASALSAKI